jgi:hypothetical protein
MNQRRIAGLIFILASCVFGIVSLTHYSTGTFNHPGPGLYPLLVSILLFVVGTLVILSGNTHQAPLNKFQFRDILIVAGAITIFAFISSHVNVLLGILIFVPLTAAVSNVTVKTSIKLILILLVLSVAGKELLNLNFAVI